MRGILCFVGTAVALSLIAAVCWLAYGLDETGRQATQTDRQVVKIAEQLATPEAPQERVVDLPEDGATYHTILLLHSDWRRRPKERRLLAWFRTEPILVSLTAQTQYWELTEDDPQYETTYKDSTPTLPAVIVMKGDGEVSYKISGDNLPDTPKPMTCELLRIFRWRHKRAYPDGCPQPTPVPEPDDGAKPTPDVKTTIDVDVRPVLEKKPAESSSDAIAWIAVLGAIAAAIVVGVGTLVYKFKQEVGI